MTARNLLEQDLVSDDPFYTVVGNSIQGSYIPATSGSSLGGTSTPGSVMPVTSGGITINLILDAAAQAAPASFKSGLQQAVAILAANITDKITVNINIDYSTTGGGAAAGPDNGSYESYSWVHSMLVDGANSGDTTFNSLPTGASIQGQSSVAVWNAQLKLWGIIGANNTTTDDASAYFSTDINPNLLVGVALHELTHAMGRVPYGSAPDVFDFFRFTSAGTRLFQGGATAPAAYFSLDNGVTKLADYGQHSDPSDFLNGGVQGQNDPFNEYYTSTTIQGLTSVDLKQLDALGFHLVLNSPIAIEVSGVTSLVQAGSYYFLNPTAGGSGPSLKLSGAAVVAGQSGGWNPIGAEQTASGYDVAWKLSGADQYSVWGTDANGNYLSNSVPVVSGTSAALESYETTFHQDLNGDGTIGLATVVIESSGATRLQEVANNYFLSPVGGGSGPSLKLSGAAVVAGQSGGWNPIGAEQTTSGYDVAWKLSGADRYSVWGTDANGNYLSNLVPVVSGAALESYETTFHQDLNGDGTIGLAGVVIESSGATQLQEVANNYFLSPVGGSSGPALTLNGAAFVAGQSGGWNPIGAEQTASGYDVAWKLSGADQYSVWGTDANGNYLSNPVPVVSGTSAALESYETTFHQDLNGDGTIGLATVVIESSGATQLQEVANNYFLSPVGGGSGPSLKLSGAAVVAGQSGGWNPIGAEQTASGYDVAWKLSGADQYSVWNTDSNGNYVDNLIPVVFGKSASLENFETTFHQDLNGDGTIGVVGSPTSTTLPNLAITDGSEYDSFVFNALVHDRGSENASSFEQVIEHRPIASTALVSINRTLGTNLDFSTDGFAREASSLDHTASVHHWSDFYIV